jgi:hypothetical protein
MSAEMPKSCRLHSGIVVPFGDHARLEAGIGRALSSLWDRGMIISHAQSNEWEQRIDVLRRNFRSLLTRTVQRLAWLDMRDLRERLMAPMDARRVYSYRTPANETQFVPISALWDRCNASR